MSLFFFSDLFLFPALSKRLRLQLVHTGILHATTVPYEDWSTQRASSCLSVSLQLPGGLSECVRNKRHLLHHLKAPFHRGIPSQSAKPYNCYGCAEAVLSLTPQALWEILYFFRLPICIEWLVCMWSCIERHTRVCAWYPVHQWRICTLQWLTKMTSWM